MDGLRRLLADEPSLATQRVYFEGGNYFREPSLLEFVAENPVRHDGLPPNIVDVARAILDAAHGLIAGPSNRRLASCHRGESPANAASRSPS